MMKKQFHFFAVVLTQVAVATAAGRGSKIDVQESKNASPFRRVVLGAARGLDQLRSLLDPSRVLLAGGEDYQPTKMQVFFAGLGRTGTTSLATAMEILGYACIDDDTSHAIMDLYGDMYKGKFTIDQVYEKIGERGFNCSFMYTDYVWAAKQENVKVVLSTRDAEKWVDSWLSVTNVFNVMMSRPFIWSKQIKNMIPFYEKLFLDIPTGGHREGWQDKDTLMKGYHIHQENVMNAVPQERLLVYNVKEGWEPLCKFLGLPIPDDISFPHVNDRLKMRITIAVFKAVTWIWPLPFLLPLWFVWKLLYKRKDQPDDKNKTD